MKIVSPTQPPIPKVAIVGEPGTGKTTILASAAEDPRTSPVLWVDIRGNPYKVSDAIGTYFQPETPNDVLEAVDFLAAGQPQKHIFRQKYGEVIPEGGYKSLAVDTMTDLQTDIITLYQDDTFSVGKQQLETMLGFEAIQALRFNTDAGIIAAKTMYMFLKIARLPLPVFVSFQTFPDIVVEETDKGGMKVKVENRVDLYGKIRMRYAGWWNLIGFTEKYVGAYDVKLKCKPTIVTLDFETPGNRGSKDQLFKGRVIPKMTEPTITKILDLVEETKNVS